MRPWLKFPIMFGVLIVLAIVAPVAGFAIGTAVIVLFHLTGIPATIVVTLAIVGGGAIGIKVVETALRRRRT